MPYDNPVIGGVELKPIRGGPYDRFRLHREEPVRPAKPEDIKLSTDIGQKHLVECTRDALGDGMAAPVTFRRPRYTVQAKKKSWELKLMERANGGIDIPLYRDSGFRKATGILGRVLRIVLRYTCTSVMAGSSKIVRKFNELNYANIDSLEEFEHVLNLIQRDVTYSWVRFYRPSMAENERGRALIKAIIIYKDLTYDAFCGFPYPFMDRFGIDHSGPAITIERREEDKRGKRKG